MPLKFAIMGFRHNHITGLINLLKNTPETQLVAACEEHPETRAAMSKSIEIAFDSYERMLDSVECDVIGVGDYYAKRGAIIIEALRRGKHVVSDKPICTSLEELTEIERLATAGKLSVISQFDVRGVGVFRRLRQLARNGELGEIHAVSFNGQHPLLHGTRAAWYFEQGKHGGTINDVAIHALDYIPWLTGTRFTTVNAARNWNARLKEVPHFKDAAQMMLTMSNGAGVLGDVSYFAPDSHGYSLPQYWRTTVWGSGGVAETAFASKKLLFLKNGEKIPRELDPAPAEPGIYIQGLLSELAGNAAQAELTTEEVLRASRVSLETQRAADLGLREVPV